MTKRIWMVLAVTALFGWNAHAVLVTYNWTVGQAIPDANPSGYVNSQTIIDGTQGQDLPDAPLISSISVRLTISGGWNGDLYVYLRHETSGGTGFTTLLNRVGRTESNPIGYTDAGFNNITLTDVITDTDIHAYGGNGGSQLGTGTYRVDSTGSSPSFSSFSGLDPAGTWSLFVADLSGNHVSTLESWGLDITAVPEPTTWAGIIFGAIFSGVQLLRFWRARMSARPQ